jgi:hypothetical protein
MNRKWLTIEKAIAVVLMCWGVVLIYVLFVMVRSLLLITGVNLNMAIFLNYHLLFLCPLLMVFGGTCLIFGKKIGWVATLIVLIASSLRALIPAEKGKSIFAGKDISITLSLIGLSIVYLLLFYILVQGPFRLKYRATARTWKTVAFGVILILLDQMILYIIS